MMPAAFPTKCCKSCSSAPEAEAAQKDLQDKKIEETEDTKMEERIWRKESGSSGTADKLNKTLRSRGKGLVALPSQHAGGPERRGQRTKDNLTFIPEGDRAADDQRIAQSLLHHEGAVGAQVAGEEHM